MARERANDGRGPYMPVHHNGCKIILEYGIPRAYSVEEWVDLHYVPHQIPVFKIIKTG